MNSAIKFDGPSSFGDLGFHQAFCIPGQDGVFVKVSRYKPMGNNAIELSSLPNGLRLGENTRIVPIAITKVEFRGNESLAGKV